MGTTPDSYQRTEDFESHVDSVRLPDEAWAVFAQLEKPSTVADIAGQTGMELEAVEKLVQHLVEAKLVRKKLMNWREFLAQKGINTTSTRMSPAGAQPPPAVLAANARRDTPAAAAPAAAVPAPKAAPAQAAAPVPPVSTPSPHRSGVNGHRMAPRPVDPTPADPENTISFRLGNDSASRSRRATLAMCITFRLGGSAHPAAVRIAPAAPAPTPTTPPMPPSARPAARPEPTPAAAPESLVAPDPEPELVGAVCGATPNGAPQGTSGFAPRRLRTLIDAITRKGGGGLQGQLLVYRVFLRVPPAVMFNAGIKSLNLVDDALEVHDEAVYDVIRKAARTVASLDLDEAIS